MRTLKLFSLALLLLFLSPAPFLAQHNGTVVGSPTFSTSGGFGYLSGASDASYVVMPSGSSSGATTFTLQAVVKTTSSVAGPLVAAVLGNPSTPALIDQGWLGMAGGYAEASLFSHDLISTIAINDGSKHVLELTCDGTTATFFVDGVIGATANISDAGVSSFSATGGYIGRYLSVGYAWPDSVGEVSVWSTVLHNSAYTVSSTPYVGTESGLVSLYHLASDANDSVGSGGSAPAPLTIGSLSASATSTGITLSLSAGLSGGTGSGYTYSLYRGTNPNFTANSGSLLSASATFPYSDATAVQGTLYYYGVVGSDSSASSVAANPAGVGAWTPSYVPYVAAQAAVGAINIVFDGDSITYGAGGTNGGTMSSPAMPYFAATKLGKLFGTRFVYGSNQGHSGHTTTDWLPSGSDYAGSKSAMQSLIAANPTALQVFSYMLGTNDSASTLTNNGGIGTSLPASTYQANLQAIGVQTMLDFPSAKVVFHEAPYYTPNTHNGATYEQAGLVFLYSYRAALVAAVAVLNAQYPGHFFVGDTSSYAYFAANYTAELQPDTSGPNGIFYLHPQGIVGSNGLIGEQTLGEMHAQAIAQALFSAGVRSYSYF
jgi:hypothetical protein